MKPSCSQNSPLVSGECQYYLESCPGLAARLAEWPWGDSIGRNRRMKELTGSKRCCESLSVNTTNTSINPCICRYWNCCEKKNRGGNGSAGHRRLWRQSHIHAAAILDISNNLPLVIEAVDTETAIRAVLPKLDR